MAQTDSTGILTVHWSRKGTHGFGMFDRLAFDRTPPTHLTTGFLIGHPLFRHQPIDFVKERFHTNNNRHERLSSKQNQSHLQSITLHSPALHKSITKHSSDGFFTPHSGWHRRITIPVRCTAHGPPHRCFPQGIPHSRITRKPQHSAFTDPHRIIQPFEVQTHPGRLYDIRRATIPTLHQAFTCHQGGIDPPEGFRRLNSCQQGIPILRIYRQHAIRSRQCHLRVTFHPTHTRQDTSGKPLPKTHSDRYPMPACRLLFDSGLPKQAPDVDQTRKAGHPI